MITLPNANGDEGVETRVLLAECRGPSFESYALTTAVECMRLMDTVLRNRMKNPGPFLARGAKSLADIVKARGQFAGFEKYPSYDNQIKMRLLDMLNIANNTAIGIAKSAEYSDPSPGTLVGWRTSKRGAPGGGFIKFKTLLGIVFIINNQCA
jgi:hypothetical protein